MLATKNCEKGKENQSTSLLLPSTAESKQLEIVATSIT
jgi:hypothetical protein